MILTVTPNTALDVTYEVDRLTPHASHRGAAVAHRAGGKGINVAAVLSLLGHQVVATGWAGGAVGAQVQSDLDVRGIAHDFAPTQREARRTVTVVAHDVGDATVFNQGGPVQTPSSWPDLVDHITRLQRDLGATVVVPSGSLPPGAPVDGFGDLVRQAGALVIVDADGDAALLPRGPPRTWSSRTSPSSPPRPAQRMFTGEWSRCASSAPVTSSSPPAPAASPGTRPTAPPSPSTSPRC